MFLRIAVGVLYLTAAVASAQHEGPQPGEPSAAQHTHKHHRHHVSFFVGGSHHAGDNGATYGAEYAYRLARRVSIGGEIEHAGGAFRDEVFTFPLIIDLYKGFKFATGPGWEAETHQSHGHDGEAEKERIRKFLYRLAVQYHFSVGKGFSISPVFSWDISSSRTVRVYGVSFGFGF